MLKLYTYFRSTAAYRVRLALMLKGLEHEAIPVHLLRDGGEHKTQDYLAKNPLGLVPALETEHGVLAQSLAIIEYLEEVYPEPALLPDDAFQRARVRAFAQTIACEMHPLNNLGVLQFLKSDMRADEALVDHWYKNWIARGFTGLERILAAQTETTFCFGETPGLADICLVPQVFNARRFNCPVDDYPNILRIDAHCRSLTIFAEAAPENQSDAE